MIHPDLKKLRDQLFDAANSGYYSSGLSPDECHRIIEAIDWQNEMFDICVDALKRYRELLSAKQPAPGYVGPYS